MSIQTIFFYLASIYMLLGIIISVSFIVVMAYVVKIVMDVKKNIDNNLEVVKSTVHTMEDIVEKVRSQPIRFSQCTGKFIAEVLVFGMQRLIRSA